jgi:hypothetical protein
MAKDLTPAQRILRRKARGLAENAGKTWANLSREERQTFHKQARKVHSDEPSQSHAQNALRNERLLREQARASAERGGKKWADLSREDRQNYLDQVRKQGG